ncbi:predicted protein [Micromonas commoda]|uniref:Cleavage/polyadenylation specificity factor A subunit C-terminal domain-containing protein n=1 Tax=Micromonas commoda (strain RCC299 / NOUM17 / CCMP2709) TaxID=296587 RepID=C1E574_MICCC|nr:predicted protein [Micromonas commoda]ACO62465.1 predicted protein [Micromonas commoda]|eukprot:XP_002501207.1 predicted protein [Micromonas commoda]
MSFAIHKQVHPPTGVDHAVAAYFTHPIGDGGPPNLVVMQANHLTVFAIRRDPSADASGDAALGAKAMSLEVVAEFDLNGTVGSIAVMRRRSGAPRNQRDALLIAVRESKLSVIEWDPSEMTVVPSSLHSWETPVGTGGVPSALRVAPLPPLAIADPEGRCAAVLLRAEGRSRLALCPAVDADADADGDGGGDDGDRRGQGPAASVRKSFVVDLTADLALSGVRDAAFLHGYGEPVVLILHEREPTWAARMPLVNDTCVLTAVSINLDTKRCTVIWQREKLPCTCYRLCAMPDPLGGAIVLSNNFLLHESQESSKALALNPLAGGGTESALGVSVELDSAHAAVLSERQVLVTTKQGALMLLSLRVEGRRLAAHGAMHLRRAGGAVLSSGMCLITKRLLFLGSRVGDSLLVSLKKKEAAGAAQMLPAAAPKKRKAGEAEPPKPPPPPQKVGTSQDDEDELEAMLYGEGEAAAKAANAGRKEDPGYTFTVRDSVLGISPIIDLTAGASASVQGDTEERAELVAACGHGKNGALAILQRGIQPELVTEVEAGTLPGLMGTWTVYHESRDNERLRESGAAAAAANVDPFHSYLVISLESTTMVLETGEELREVSEAVELVTDAATLAAGNMHGRKRIAQVHKGGVRICEGPVKIQDLSAAEMPAAGDVSPDLEIIAAQVLDPYVLCRMSDGSLRVLKGDEEKGSVEAMSPSSYANLPTGESIASAALVDDSVPAAERPGLTTREPGFLRRTATSTGVLPEDEEGTVLAVTRVGGTLELYALPSCERIWSADGLSEGLNVLAPGGAGDDVNVDGDGEVEPTDDYPAPEIVEFRLDAFPRAHERPMLTALRGDGSVLVYRAFLCPPGAGNVGHEAKPQLRFCRVPIELEGGGGGMVDTKALSGSRLTRFERVGDRGGIRGVFVSGPRPLWLLVRRSRVLALPIRGEAQRTVSFTPFHNVNCLNGFMLGTAAGGVRICQIPGRMHYEAAWPVRKLALRCTPHHVQYLPDFRLYALSTSAPVKWKDHEVNEDDIHLSTLIKVRKANAMAKGGVEQVFSLRLLVPGTLECAWQYTVDPGEHVQSIRNVQLRNTMTGALQSMLVVGTALPGGEDAPCRGRVLIFEVVWQMTDRGTKWQGQLVCVRDAKMACTALEGVGGHLAVAIGTKLIVHSWDGHSLMPVAFFDTPLHTVTMNVVKNFILLGDIQKGAFFFRWKDTPDEKLLVQMAKDFEGMDILATEFLVDGSTLSMLTTDMTGNAFIFSYDPKSLESWKGQKLLTKGAFHVGSPVHRMVRFRLKAPTAAPGQTISPAEQKAQANRHAVFFGTLDGSLGILVPIEEAAHASLQSLQRYLTYATPHAALAGLNARTHRHPKTVEGRPMRQPAPHSLLDGGLLAVYEHMPWKAQAKAAKEAGMTRDVALGHLHQLSARTAFM